MEQEIREQPALLEVNAARYYEELSRLLQGREFESVLLIARGSSDHAALYARYLIEINLQIPAILAAPSVFTRYGANVQYRRCLAIGISQSGAAPDVAEVLARVRQAGHTTLAITNTAKSKVGAAAELELNLGGGEERSVAATKTYSLSLLGLYQCARAMGASLPAPNGKLPGEDWLDDTEQAALKAVPSVTSSDPVFALGRGYDFATAQECALKLMECALIPCKAYSTADFQHGPRTLAREGSASIVFGQSQPYLLEQGGSAVEAPSPHSKADESLHPIWNAFFCQWLALYAARQKGLDPDRTDFLSKITETL